jgi:hypothetical protein
MFESEADRVAMIRALGGVLVSAPRGTCDGLLETGYVGDGDLAVDNADARVTVRTSDATRLGLSSGIALQVDGTSYLVRTPQPDGSGMTLLVLELP